MKITFLYNTLIFKRLIHITILVVKFSLCYSQANYSQFSKDTIELSKYIKLSRSAYLNDKNDSLYIYTLKAITLANKTKVKKYNPEIYWAWGYYRKRTFKYAEALDAFNKGEEWAKKNKNFPYLGRINYEKSTVYCDIYLKHETAITRKNLINQLYETLNDAYSYPIPEKFKAYNYHLLSFIYGEYNIGDSVHYNYIKNYIFLAGKTHVDKDIYLINLFKKQILENNLKGAKESFLKLEKLTTKNKLSIHYFSHACHMIHYCLFTSHYEFAIEIDKKLAELSLNKNENFDPFSKLLYYQNKSKIFFYKKKIKESYQYNDSTNILLKSVQRKNPYKKSPYEIVPYFIRLQLLHNILLNTKRKKYREVLDDYKQLEVLDKYINSVKSQFNVKKIESKVFFDISLKENAKKYALIKSNNLRLILLKKKEKQFVTTIIVLSGIFIIVFLYLFYKSTVQKNKLEELKNTQNIIFRVIGHDLRGPILTTRMTLINLASASSIDLEKFQFELSKKIPYLNSLILTFDNLLYWANVQKESFESTPTRCNVRELTDEVLELLSINIETKQINLEYNIRNDLYFYVDTHHFKIIFRNLLQNAVKFTPLGGKICISYTLQLSHVYISIQNSGTSFQNSANSHEKGTGLGLFLVRKLLHLNNGTLSMSDSPAGVTQTIVLPLSS